MSWWQDAYNKDSSPKGVARDQAKETFLKEAKKKTQKAQKLYKWTLKL